MVCQFLYATDILFHFKFELHRAQPCWFNELCLEYESIETCGVSAASGQLSQELEVQVLCPMPVGTTDCVALELADSAQQVTDFHSEA